MQTIASRSAIMGVVFAEVVTAVLLLVEGSLLIDAGINGLTGAGTLMVAGDVGILWAILSIVAAYGLRSGKRWSWNLTLVLSGVAIGLSAGLIGLAATITGAFVYPGLAVVLLITVNDVILAEVAVAYFLMKPDVRAQFAKAA